MIVTWRQAADRWGARARYATAIATAYFALAVLSIALSRSPDSIAVLWYANAIGTAGLCTRPLKEWPPLLLVLGAANLLANLVVGSTTLEAACFVPGNVLEMFVGATLIRRSRLLEKPDRHPLSDPAALLALLGLGGSCPPCWVPASALRSSVARISARSRMSG